MNETHTEPLTVWRFIRRCFVRIVIGAVLMAAVYAAVLVWMPYQREQRIVKEIEACRGKVNWQYFSPDWIPQSMRERTTLFNRVTCLHLDNTQVTDTELEHLKGLPNLTALDLRRTKVTDAGLEHLKGLTNLEWLDLASTHVTDTGLERFKGLTNLTKLDLRNTKVSDAGLEHLMGLCNLTELDVRNTQVTDAGLEHLKGLTNLESIYITNRQVTAAGRAILRNVLPNCTIAPDRN